MDDRVVMMMFEAFWIFDVSADSPESLDGKLHRHQVEQLQHIALCLINIFSPAYNTRKATRVVSNPAEFSPPTPSTVATAETLII